MRGWEAVAICCVLAGCASKAADVKPAYVSPNLYAGYSCDQLAEEGQRISSRAAAAAGEQDKNRKNDIVKTTAGVILFWPIILANDGDGQVTAELASLKGQMKAIEEESVRKNCGIQFRNRT